MLWFYLLLIESDEDRSRFEQLYNKYENQMFHAANRILRDKSLAEDAVQTAFLKIAKNFGKVLEKIWDLECHKTRGYLIIVVENEAKQIYNQRNRFNTVSYEELGDSVPAGDSPLETMIDKLSADEMLVIIRKLPKDDNEIMMLRCVFDYDYKKISDILHITSAAARKRLERAKIKFTALCEKEGALDDKRFLSESEAEAGAGAISG